MPSFAFVLGFNFIHCTCLKKNCIFLGVTGASGTLGIGAPGFSNGGSGGGGGYYGGGGTILTAFNIFSVFCVYVE